MNPKQIVLSVFALICIIFIPSGILILYYNYLGLIGEFFAYILFLIVFIFGTITLSLFGPSKLTYSLEDWTAEENKYKPDGYDKSKWNILLDTHFHTKYSDGRMTIEQGILWHIAMGFNAFFVTDHDTFDNYQEIMSLSEKYKDKILVLPGIEIANELCHFNLLGINRFDYNEIFPNKEIELKMTPEDKTKAIIKYAHDQGGLVTINHYPWSTGGDIPRYDPKKHPTMEQAIEWGFDFMEACNWDDDISPIDKIAYKFCKEHKEISPVVGTDVHIPEKDRLYGWTLVHTEGFTAESLMNALRNHKNNPTEVLYKEGGIPYPTKHKINKKYRLIQPLAEIGEFFVNFHKDGAIRNIDWKRTIIWILYFVVFFIMIKLFCML